MLITLSQIPKYYRPQTTVGPGNHHRLTVGNLPVLEVDLLPQVPRHLVLPIHRLLADIRASSYIATLSSAFNQVKLPQVIRSESTPQS